MTTTLFITGTDTGVGKTHIATLLLQQAAAQGISCVGFKPVAAGGRQTAAGFCNEDALALQAAGSVHAPYELINPYLLREAAAPHIAAAEEGVRLQAGRIFAAHADLADQAELVIVEGAGGWQVPLNDKLNLGELVGMARWPVILVVGMRLGCLNHALLSADAIRAKTTLLGWIANCLPPRQPHLDQNVSTLLTRVPAPLLAVVPGQNELPPMGWPLLPDLSIRALLSDASQKTGMSVS